MTHNGAESSECSPQSSDTVLLQLLRKFLFLDALGQQQSKKTDAPEKSQPEFMKLFYAVQTQVYLMSLVLNDLWNSIQIYPKFTVTDRHKLHKAKRNLK